MAGDGFSVAFKGITDTQAEFGRINKAMDRATMYGIRQGGRKIKQYARRAAPVYRGKPRERWYHGQVTGAMGKGDLKNSISSWKQLRRYGANGYLVGVTPHGVANIYATRQEQRRPFMAPAIARVDAEFPAIMEKAWKNASKPRK